MSDSDSDNMLLPNNTYAYQSGSTMIGAKGPDISQNFQNNNLTSIMNLPWNLERPSYAQSVCDQRSIGHRRETSTMSLHGQSQSYYHGRAASYRGTYRGRSGSPAMSTRTMDSNLSAIDIAAAVKTQKFNEYDVRRIKIACQKFMKQRLRKRVEKRKNFRSFLKGSKFRFKDDSGNEGSDSSISSDDCRSTRTFRTSYRNISSCRSTNTDFTDFRKTMTESNIYRDITDNLRQHSLRNMCSVEPRSVKENALRPQNLLQSNVSISQKDRFKNGFLLPSHRFNQLVASLPIPEKENRWQRPNIDYNVRNIENGNKRQERLMSGETESEQEEIFSEKRTLNGNRTQRKRSLDADGEIHTSNNKRNKLSSPQTKLASKLTVPKQTNSGNDPKKPKDFEFAKPQFPVKKLGNMGKAVYKSQLAKKKSSSSVLQSSEQLISSSNQQSAEKSILKSGQKSAGKLTPKSAEKPTDKTASKSVDQPTEKLISKSAQHEIVISKASQQPNTLEHQPMKQNLLQTDVHQETENNEETIQFSTTNMSMGPSFIKRKLFTQKVDTESKNSSSENLTDSSLTNIYSTIQKEKNKTRKITTQSCLSRDILGDESNLLDLIHKIVPKDRMNTTNAVNKTDITNKSKPDADNKWDVTAAISTCNKDDVSDTYTDEEIFKVDEQNITNKKKNLKVNTPKRNPTKKCKVVAGKIPENNRITNVARQSTSPEVVKATKNIILPVGDIVGGVGDIPVGLKKSNLYDCVKSFWDTDDESDMDYGGSSHRKSNLEDDHTKGTSISKNDTTNNINTKKHDVTINKQQLQTKTKLVKTAEKDTGINKNPTTKSQEPKSKPKHVTTKNQEDSNKKPNSKTNIENKNKTVSSKKKEVTSRPIKTKNIDDKDLNTKKNKETTPKKINKKSQEDSKKISTSKTNTENNNKTVRSKKKEVTSRSIKTKNVDDKDLNTKQKEETTPKKIYKKSQEDSNKKPNSKTNTENKNKTVRAKKKEVTSRSIKTKTVDDKDLNTKQNEVTIPKESLENINKTVTTKNNDDGNFKKPKNDIEISKNQGDKVKATNNNTLKVCPQTGESIQSKTTELNESNDTFIKTLRTRVIDLSSSSISEQANPSNKPASKRGRPPKKNNVTKISKEDSRSDISFSLTDKISPSSKPNKRMSNLIKNKIAAMKPRRSDISFTLISDKRATNRSKIRHKEVELLQMNASFFLSSSKKSSRTRRNIPCC